MLRAFVVDDEKLTLDLIGYLLKDNKNVTVEGYFSNPVEALTQLYLKKPDVVFLDIGMPEMDGLEFAQKLYEADLNVEVIFITAYNQYALDAFKVNALDYLMKPVLEEELERAINRVMKRRIRGEENSQEILEITNKGENEKALTVEMFGSFSVKIQDSDKHIKWFTSKCGELFAYLILNKKRAEISKWKLIDALWPEKNEEKGDINLRSTACRLNKTLREHGLDIRVISQKNNYCMEIGRGISIKTNIDVLEELYLKGQEIGKKEENKFESIFINYEGQLLEAFDYQWINDLREKYHQQFISVSKNFVRWYMKNNVELSKIQNVVEKILKVEPYDEEIQKLALQLDFFLGGKSKVISKFQALSDIMENELGVSPQIEVVELFNSLTKTR
jgi:two-component SAPR family response regulator